MKKIFYGWWIVAVCFFFALCVASIAFFGFTAFFDPLVREFGWSYAQVSLAASLRGLEMGIFAPFLGFFVDRFGGRKLMFGGILIFGLGLILLSFTRSLTMFYASFILVGLGGGACTNVVLMSVVANWFNKKIGTALGIMSMGFGASGLVIPLIVKLIEVYQWRTALIILGLIMIILGAPLSLLIRNRPEDLGLSSDGAAEPGPAASRQEAAQSEPEMPFRMAFRYRPFLYLNIVEFLRMMGVVAVVTHVMPYLDTLGFSRDTAGLVAAAIPLASNLGRFGFGWLGDRFEKRFALALAFAAMGTGLIAFHYAQSGWTIILFLLLFSPGFGGSMVLRGALIREYFGRATFGRLIGITMGSASLGGIVGPTLAGWVFDSTGNYHLTWVFLCALNLLAILLIWKIKPMPVRS